MSKVTADKSKTGVALTGKTSSAKTTTNGTTGAKKGKAPAGKAVNGKEISKSTAKTEPVKNGAKPEQNDFISLADEADLQENSRAKSARSQTSQYNRERSSNGRISNTTNKESVKEEDDTDQEGLEKARQKMSELEENARIADADFEAEYEEVKSRNKESLSLLYTARVTLDEQAVILEDSTFEQMFSEVTLVESLRRNVFSTRRILMASEKYTSNDIMDELVSLRTSLRRCVEIFSRKVNVEVIDGKASGRAVRINPEALEQLAAASVEFKELERNVLEMIRASQKLMDEIQKGSAEIEELEKLIERSQEKAQNDKKKEPEVEETNNEEQEPENEQTKKKQEEEAEEARKKRQEEEEEAERERLKREQEKEERIRKEKEEEEKRRNEDPRSFPTIVYNLDPEDDNTGCGVACVIRVPSIVPMVKDQLRVTSLDMVTNRYQPGDNEELVSNIIYVRPDRPTADGLNFEAPIWLAVPCSGISRGKELSVKVCQVRPPREARKHSTVNDQDEQLHAQGEDKTLPASHENINSAADENVEESKNNTEQREKVATENEERKIDETEKNNEDTKKENVEESKNNTEQREKVATENEENNVIDETGKTDEDTKKDQNAGEKELVETPQQLEARSRKVSRISIKQEAEQKKPEEEAEAEPEWVDVLTRETTVEGQESIKFVETMFDRIPAYGFKIVIVIRPKTESERFSSKGGRLVYSLDARNTIFVPEKAFRLGGDVSMQVIAVDSSVMNGFKERYEGCDTLLGSSPFINVGLTPKPSKPLTFTVANPSGGNRPRRAAPNRNGLPGNRKVSLPSLTTTRQAEATSAADADVVSLMAKDLKGKWKHYDDVEITSTKELTTFKISGAFDRLVLLRTSGAVDSNDLCKISSKLETALLERSVSVVVRQSVSELEKVILELTRTENVEKVEERLIEEEFSEGPETNELIFLQEGELIEVSFRDNIHFEDGKPRRIVFNSNLQSGKLSTTIRIVDTFAQNALEAYRGNIQLSLVGKEYRAPPKISNATKKPKNAGKGFMCEIAVTLPKPMKEVWRINKAEVIIPTEGPISEEYFDHLSRELGEEWLQVAAKLGHNVVSIQRIQQTFANLSGTAEGTRRCIKTMLIDWFKASKKSKHKVGDLYVALVEGRRNDLADELLQKDRELREEYVQREKEGLLEKCSKAYSESSAARRHWRPVAKALGLAPEDISTVGGSPLVQEISVEQAREMLTRWQGLKGEAATKESLVMVLKKLKLNEAAANVSLVR